MNAKLLAHRALWVGALVGLAGCAGTSPITTAPNQQAPDRHVLANGGGTVADVADAQQLISQLPKRISAAEAKTMLVQIDPSQIKDGEREVQQVWRGWRGLYGWGGTRAYALYNRFSFLPYSSYYFPYYYNSGYYYPYTYNTYSPYLSTYYPYLYLANSLYRPYRWYW